MSVISSHNKRIKLPSLGQLELTSIRNSGEFCAARDQAMNLCQTKNYWYIEATVLQGAGLYQTKWPVYRGGRTFKGM